MVESSTPERSPYAAIFERKVTEIFDFLDIDPKKALKLTQKEIETRAKRITKAELLMLRVVKAVVLERCLRVGDARSELLSVLDQIEQENVLDHYLLDTLQRSVARMTVTHREEYLTRYQSVIERLVNEHPKDKELVRAVYDGSLRSNKFA